MTSDIVTMETPVKITIVTPDTMRETVTMETQETVTIEIPEKLITKTPAEAVDTMSIVITDIMGNVTIPTDTTGKTVGGIGEMSRGSLVTTSIDDVSSVTSEVIGDAAMIKDEIKMEIDDNVVINGMENEMYSETMTTSNNFTMINSMNNDSMITSNTAESHTIPLVITDVEGNTIFTTADIVENIVQPSLYVNTSQCDNTKSDIGGHPPVHPIEITPLNMSDTSQIVTMSGRNPSAIVNCKANQKEINSGSHVSKITGPKSSGPQDEETELYGMQVASESGNKCHICGESNKLRKNLITHLIECHQLTESDVRHTCEVCGKWYNKKNSYIQHMGKHKKQNTYKCHLCDQTFHRLCILKRHLVVHTQERSYKCDICSKSYSRKGVLKIHQRIHQKVQSEQKIHICPDCGKYFALAASLDRHLKNNHGCEVKVNSPEGVCTQNVPLNDTTKKTTIILLEKNVNAYEVQQDYRNTDGLPNPKLVGNSKVAAGISVKNDVQFHEENITHVTLTSGEIPQSRTRVDEETENASGISLALTNNDMINTTVNSELVLSSPTSSQPGNSLLLPKPHRPLVKTCKGDCKTMCELCGVKSYSSGVTEESEGVKGHDPWRKATPKVSLQRPPLENSSVSTGSECGNHTVVHPTSSTLTSSETSSVNVTAEIPHHATQNEYTEPVDMEKIKHVEDLVHKCTVCQIDYPDTICLMDHINATHPNMKSYQCFRCGKDFQSTSKFTSHIKEKMQICKLPNRCDRCGYTCVSNTILQRHLAVLCDTTAFPYKCSVCGKSFKKLYWLIHHTSAHTEKMSFQCDKCSETFFHANLLSEHILKYCLIPDIGKYKYNYTVANPGCG